MKKIPGARYAVRPLRAIQRQLNHLLPPPFPPGAFPIEATTQELRRIEACLPYTMTTPPRQWSMLSAVTYIVRARVPGAIVECGVWRGGMMMLAALTLLAEGDTQRELILFDTFAGMTEPADIDRYEDLPAKEVWKQRTGSDDISEWCRASLGDVQRNMATTAYPETRIRYVEGRVETTLKERANLPDSIALLRLDTDWYESSRLELEVLYPRLSPNGVLLIDDYGHWEGVRRATDEYFANRPALLTAVDYASRVVVKPSC
jgi:O-methyltransferase